MTHTTVLAATASLRGLSALTVLLGAALLLSACGSDPRVRTTSTQQTTTRQIGPAAMPASTTTVTKTQQNVP